MTELGTYIYSLRKQKKLSQTELAKRTGTKRGYISRLERGKVKKPTLDALEKIAKNLEIPVDSLLFFDATEHSFHDILQQSQELKQKIGSLKNDLYKLQRLVKLAEKNETSLFADELKTETSFTLSANQP